MVTIASTAMPVRSYSVEETGRVSVAFEGKLTRNVDADTLRKKLESIQNKTVEEKQRKVWKGRLKREEK